MKASDISRIIEMAWEDRTPFDAIEDAYGLTEKEVKSGHWMAREKPVETNKIIKDWLEVIK